MKKRLKMVLGGVVALLLLASMMFGTITASAEQGTKPVKIFMGYANMHEFDYPFKTVENNPFEFVEVEVDKYANGEEQLQVRFGTKEFQDHGSKYHVDRIKAAMYSPDSGKLEMITLNPRQRFKFGDEMDKLVYNPKKQQISFLYMEMSATDGSTMTYAMREVSQRVDSETENSVLKRARDFWAGSESGSASHR